MTRPSISSALSVSLWNEMPAILSFASELEVVMPCARLRQSVAGTAGNAGS